MRAFVKRNSQAILVAVVTATLVGTPSIARIIADYAKNADKVDGKHAVGAGASKSKRAGKLVATDKKGFLPRNILRRYRGVVVVAKSGGDFKKIQPAVDSITDATPNRRYLIWIAPGTYKEIVEMTDYIDLQGAGRRLVKIKCSCGQALNSSTHPMQGPLFGAEGEVRSLTLVNAGSTSISHGFDSDSNTILRDVTIDVSNAPQTVGVFSTGPTLELDDVDISTDGTQQSWAIRSTQGTDMSLRDVEADATGTEAGYGVELTDGSLTINDSDISGRGGTSQNYGIKSDNGILTVEDSHVSTSGDSPAASWGISRSFVGTPDPTPETVISNSKITAVGSSENYVGLGNFSVDATLSDVTIKAGAGDNNIGIFNGTTSFGPATNTLKVDHSRISTFGPPGATIANNSGWTSKIGATLLDGGAATGTGTFKCVAVYEESYSALNTPPTCP